MRRSRKTEIVNLWPSLLRANTSNHFKEYIIWQGNSCRSGRGPNFIPNCVKSPLSVLFFRFKVNSVFLDITTLTICVSEQNQYFYISVLRGDKAEK